MRIIGKQCMFGRTAVALAAACLLLLQTVVAGLAMGVAFSGTDSFSLVCSGGKSSDASSSDRQTPHHHHSGACCILHNEAAVEPGPTGASTVARAVTPIIVGLSPAPFGAIHDAPETASQSARAPPLLVA